MGSHPFPEISCIVCNKPVDLRIGLARCKTRDSRTAAAN